MDKRAACFVIFLALNLHFASSVCSALESSLLGESALCIQRCLVTSLACTHWAPVAHTWPWSLPMTARHSPRQCQSPLGREVTLAESHATKLVECSCWRQAELSVLLIRSPVVLPDSCSGRQSQITAQATRRDSPKTSSQMTGTTTTT